MFLKAFHFWIVETREYLVLKLIREVPISSSAPPKKKLQPEYAGIECMVIDLFSREFRGQEKIPYCTQLSSEDGDKSM